MSAAPADAAMAPWIARQVHALLAQRGHAWLLAGPSGLGQYSLALALVRAWLCERPTPLGACGQCPACHNIAVRTHADLCVLMPAQEMQTHGWPMDDAPGGAEEEGGRKLSKEIRVAAMRSALEFAQRTSARGRGKALLVFPAERMNTVTANALLKTLEEPAGDIRFVLASEAAHLLLPTLRSRCLAHTMLWPPQQEALDWLQAQGLSASHALAAWRAAGGRPQAALEMAPIADLWAGLPRRVMRADAAPFKDWRAAQVLDALHKLCHDVLARKAGAAPRFFSEADLPTLPGGGSWAALTAWSRALSQARRSQEHPYNPGLMLEALLSQAQLALNSSP